jgi:heme exporter protein C
MGEVQRVFYFHVATAWVGSLGFIAAGVAGVIYLIKKDRKWDVVGLAAVEISLVFFFIAIIMGSVWARPIWNTWWTWDPRLTTANVVELIYALTRCRVRVSKTRTAAPASAPCMPSCGA